MPSGGAFVFGPFHLDAGAKKLLRDGKRVPLPERYVDVLHALVSRAGEVLTKNYLVKVAWQDERGDGSLTQAIFHIRRALDPANPDRYIVTVSGRGYRFVEPVTRTAPRTTDDEIDAILLLPDVSQERRNALQALHLDRITPRRSEYEQILAHKNDDPRVHAGLAAAYLAQYEGTRADLHPDADALRRVGHHSREAVRLDVTCAETWVTLGLALARTGDHQRARGAFQQAIALRPQDWGQYLQWGWASWGRERLEAAARVLDLMPGHPLAHLLIATVWVPRNARSEAERDVDCGIATMARGLSATDAFPPIALYWLKGKLLFARGAGDEALAAFAKELALDVGSHIYARETAANTWYAIGAVYWSRGNKAAARDGFERAIALVATHAMAHAGLALLSPRRRRKGPIDTPATVDAAMAQAAILVADGDVAGAARLVRAALIAAPPGSAGWTIPIDPLLRVWREPDAWADVLVELRKRAM